MNEIAHSNVMLSENSSDDRLSDLIKTVAAFPFKYKNRPVEVSAFKLSRHEELDRRRMAKLGRPYGDKERHATAYGVWLRAHPWFECAYCRRWNVEANDRAADHWVPLARGGRHEVANLLPSCKRCNASKRANVGGIRPRVSARLTVAAWARDCAKS